MSKPVPKKCLTCSQLPAMEAHHLHGPEGDKCWNPKVCYARRTYYKNRQKYIAAQWQRRHPGESRTGKGVGLNVQLPEYPVAVIQMYRSNASSDVHAVGSELWVGGELVARVEPVHCLGLTEGQVKAHLRRSLRALSEYQGVELKAFGSEVTFDPKACPLNPCPLKP